MYFSEQPPLLSGRELCKQGKHSGSSFQTLPIPCLLVKKPLHQHGSLKTAPSVSQLAKTALPASSQESCSFPAFERVLCSLNDSLNGKYYYPRAIEWLSNYSGWVAAQIVEIAIKEIIHANKDCGIHTSAFFFFNLAFFLWLFCAHLNQIYERKVSFSMEAFSCIPFLCYNSPRASEPLLSFGQIFSF